MTTNQVLRYLSRSTSFVVFAIGGILLLAGGRVIEDYVGGRIAGEIIADVFGIFCIGIGLILKDPGKD